MIFFAFFCLFVCFFVSHFLKSLLNLLAMKHVGSSFSNQGSNRHPALEGEVLRLHWTTREVPRMIVFEVMSFGLSCYFMNPYVTLM